MPYKCDGANLMHLKDGKWSVKQHCSSEANCHSAMRLLYGLESGSIKKSEVGKQKSKPKMKLLNKHQ